MSISRLKINARLAGATMHNNVAYLSGQVPDDRGQDCGGQTRQVLKKIDTLLAAAGTDKSKLLSAQIWLKDIGKDFAILNEVWEAWLPAGSAPARATIQAEMASPEVLVEIMITAAV